MAEPHLLYEKRGHIAHVTFNRPAQRNALSPEAFCRLADAWTDFAADDDLRVALISGAGGQAFTAGADLKLMMPLLLGTRPPADEWDERLLAEEKMLTDVGMLKKPIYKPIIAAVNGACIGAGSEMMQAIDIRICGQGSFFAINEVALGFMPGGGSAVRLARQVPYAKAMELLLLGDRFDAAHALAMGFVNSVLPPDEVLPTAQRLAERIAEYSPLAVRKTKETVLRTLGLPAEQAFVIEAENYALVAASEDAKEGPRAFAEKRKPMFTGR